MNRPESQTRPAAGSTRSMQMPAAPEPAARRGERVAAGTAVSSALAVVSAVAGLASVVAAAIYEVAVHADVHGRLHNLLGPLELISTLWAVAAVGVAGIVLFSSGRRRRAVALLAAGGAALAVATLGYWAWVVGSWGL
jgi:hypothetical protein